MLQTFSPFPLSLLISPPFSLLRNVGLMSVRVRYRLTNYQCPPSLPPSFPPSLSLMLSFNSVTSCSLLHFETLCTGPLLPSPAVTSTSAVVTGAEERTNREDLSQNPKKHQKEKRNFDSSSPLCVCVCVRSVFDRSV